MTVLVPQPDLRGASNHRYDTGDYRKVDPILGTNTDFKKLCAAAADCGIAHRARRRVRSHGR
ncbi:MAG: alpha-amylase family glycosyl hydrolase [Oscillospiraceae bacterium]